MLRNSPLGAPWGSYLYKNRARFGTHFYLKQLRTPALETVEFHPLRLSLSLTGQIVDKRDLLSAGLNLSAPNTRNLGLGLGKKSKDEPVVIHTAAGTAASRREINQRRQREIEEQLAEEQVRVREQKAREEEEERQRVIRKRNNDDDILSARERYLERKRRKLEEGNSEPVL